MNGLIVTTPPAAAPVNIDQFKTHRRITAGGDDGSEDLLIVALINAATTMVENLTGRALVSRQYVFTVPSFFNNGNWKAINLPMPPLISVESVKYRDGDGIEQTLDQTAYYIALTTTPAYIRPITDWPYAQPCRPDAVQIAYTAGYGEAKAVPPDLYAAILMIAGHLYENREASLPIQLHDVPMAVQTIITEYARPRI